MVYYCQKRHFVNNRSFLFFDYCQKRCFVKKTVTLLTDPFVNYKNLLNYTGKYEYENEYDDEYDLKK